MCIILPIFIKIFKQTPATASVMNLAQTFTPLQDIKLQTIDFNWIKQTTKISHLKRAIRLIQLDGNFYADLKQACYERIGELDPTQKKIVIDHQMDANERQQIENQLSLWERLFDGKSRGIGAPQHKQIFDSQNGQQQFDSEAYFNNDPNKVDKKKQAENQKNKGNQSIRSKDFDEAIRYYTNSIRLDPTLPQTYSNRALAYIKLKEFKKALDDCESALRIDPKYIKAHHRKAKSLIGLKNKVDAYTALQQALKIEPDNSQCLSDLKDLREEMNEQEKGKLQGQSKFKKIVIQQDSEQQQEQIEQK